MTFMQRLTSQLTKSEFKKLSWIKRLTTQLLVTEPKTRAYPRGTFYEVGSIPPILARERLGVQCLMRAPRYKRA